MIKIVLLAGAAVVAGCDVVDCRSVNRSLNLYEACMRIENCLMDKWDASHYESAVAHIESGVCERRNDDL